MNILPYQKPNKIVLQKSSDFEGAFEFKPLERGFGQTIGNSLRRVLLSSLEGYAVSAVRIHGVDRQEAQLKGVKQDVVDMILNLKQLRIRPVDEAKVDKETKIYIAVSGQEKFTGADIGAVTNLFEVINPELVICEMEPSVKLEMELFITKGRGYVPADEKAAKKLGSGVMAIDAIYTPIENVDYRVENTRVEQRTDYENLTIDLKTDGSIKPEDAVKAAARILIEHFSLIADEKVKLPKGEGAGSGDEDQDHEIAELRRLLQKPLEELDLSVRSYNCLKAADVKTLGDLVRYEASDLLKFRNFGRRSLAELEDLLQNHNLTFGMDLDKYNL